MPLTALDLCTMALVKLGASPIQSLDADSVEATVARTLYPIVRDAMLVAHPWSFTIAQAEITAEAGQPVADFAYAFVLPSDHLRTVSAGVGSRGRGLTYRIMGTRLLADANSVVIQYQRRVGEDMFPAFFGQLLVTRLAAEFCLPVTESSTRAADLYRLADAELRLARLIDSQQSTPQAVEDYTLISARGA